MINIINILLLYIGNQMFYLYYFYSNNSTLMSKLEGAVNKGSTGRWTHREHLLFLDGLKIYGRNWKQISKHVQTRNGAQIRSHAQKYFDRLNKIDQGTDDAQRMKQKSTSYAQLTSAPEQEINIHHSYYFSQICKIVAQIPNLSFWEEFMQINNECSVQKNDDNLNKFKHSFTPFEVKQGQKQPTRESQEQNSQ